MGKEIKKTLYWIDREWYDVERKTIVGDMGFSLCDASETLTDNFDELKSSMISYAIEEILKAEEDSEEYLANNVDFPIYSILKAEFEYVEGEYITLHDMADETKEVVFTLAYCTSERLKQINNSGCDIKVDCCVGDYCVD